MARQINKGLQRCEPFVCVKTIFILSAKHFSFIADNSSRSDKIVCRGELEEMMKNLFVVTLIVLTLGGCASIDKLNASRNDVMSSRSEFTPTELSSVTYLYSLNQEDVVTPEAHVGASELAQMTRQGGFIEFNSASEQSEDEQSELN